MDAEPSTTGTLTESRAIRQTKRTEMRNCNLPDILNLLRAARFVQSLEREENGLWLFRCGGG